jgi:hypothetical protein
VQPAHSRQKDTNQRPHWFWLASLIPTLLCALVDGRLQAQMPDSVQDKMQAINPRIPAPFEIDLDRVAAHGIRVLEGKHLILFTDANQRPDVEQFPLVFELAVAQWCQYFVIDPVKAQDWKMRAFVIENSARFEKAGLLPDTLPQFPAGFQNGRDMWLYLQPGDYYTRHLLLHEGTHAIMDWFLDGWGSPWYSEGMAEKLGLHQWIDRTKSGGPELQLNFAVKKNLQVPDWGRVGLVRKDLEQGQGLTLGQVVSLPTNAFRDVRHYGWAWAACEFLSKHNLTRDSFSKLHQQVAVGKARFDALVAKIYQQHSEILERDWVLFIHELDYGVDITKITLKPAREQRQTNAASVFQIDSSHAWQTTSFKVERGDRLRLQCHARFQVGLSDCDEKSTPWISTADGITLEYYQGKPLGSLLAGTLDEKSTSPNAQVAGLLSPVIIGSNGTLEATAAGRLCLRINDSPAEMHDNQGALEVSIDKVK